MRRNEEICLDTFEMKGLGKILLVSWTAKKTNEWVLNKVGVKRELLDTVKSYYGHTMRKQGSCLEIMQGTMPGAQKTTHGLNGKHQHVDRTIRAVESQSE